LIQKPPLASKNSWSILENDESAHHSPIPTSKLLEKDYKSPLLSGNHGMLDSASSFQRPLSFGSYGGILNQGPEIMSQYTVPSFQFVPPKWFYQDPSMRDQGPFSSEEMHAWYKEGYFPPALPIKCEGDPNYIPLLQFVEKYGSEAPFLESLRDQEALEQSLHMQRLMRQQRSPQYGMGEFYGGTGSTVGIGSHGPPSFFDPLAQDFGRFGSEPYSFGANSQVQPAQVPIPFGNSSSRSFTQNLADPTLDLGPKPNMLFGNTNYQEEIHFKMQKSDLSSQLKQTSSVNQMPNFLNSDGTSDLSRIEDRTEAVVESKPESKVDKVQPTRQAEQHDKPSNPPKAQKSRNPSAEVSPKKTVIPEAQTVESAPPEPIVQKPAPAAPWAGVKSATGSKSALKDIQEKEQKEMENRLKKEQLASEKKILAEAQVLAQKEAANQSSLVANAQWAAQKPAKPSKTLAEIMEDEEKAKQQSSEKSSSTGGYARSVVTSAATQSKPLKFAKAVGVKSVVATAPLVKPVATVQIDDNSKNDGWNVVAKNSKKSGTATPSPVTPQAPKASAAAKPVTKPGNTNGGQEEVINWCKSVLKPVESKSPSLNSISY
jgi:hypothetical protein